MDEHSLYSSNSSDLSNTGRLDFFSTSLSFNSIFGCEFSLLPPPLLLQKLSVSFRAESGLLKMKQAWLSEISHTF